MKTISARAMMEGAILASLTAIIGIFFNVPIIGMLTMFWPVPIIIVGYRNGFRTSMFAAFIAAVLLALFATPIVGFILFVTFAVPGSVMGYMMRKHYKPKVTLFVCGAILTVTAALQFVLSLELVLGIPIIEIIGNLDASISGYFKDIYNQTSAAADVYTQYGFGEDAVKSTQDRLYQAIMQLKILMPSIFLTSGIATCYLNFKAVTLILNRIGYKVEDVGKFSELRLNNKYKYIVLGLTFAVLLLNSYEVKFLYEFYTNLWALLRLFYSVLGISVIVFIIARLAARHEIPLPVKGLMYAFIPVLMIAILPYIGMFDIAADIRRLDRVLQRL